MNIITKRIFFLCLALFAWMAHAQQVTLSPSSAVIYVGDSIEIAITCPRGYPDAEKDDNPRDPILTTGQIRRIGPHRNTGPQIFGRTFTANRPGVVTLEPWCGSYKVPDPAPIATLTVLPKGNGKGRFDPTALSIAVGATGRLNWVCDGGARPVVTNSDPSIASMAVSGNQAVFTGLREGSTGISLTCDKIAAASARITTNHTFISAAQAGYDQAKSNDTDAKKALTTAQTNLKNAIDAQKRAAEALEKHAAICRVVSGCVVR